MSSRSVTIWVLVVVFVATGTVFAGIDDGLVVYYEFEGNANDSSENNYNGTEIGGLSYVEGVIGYAASFDGIDDYIDMGTKLSGYPAFSLFAWIRADTLKTGNNFIQSSNWYVNDPQGDDGGFQLSITNGYIKSWVNQPNRTASSEIAGPYVNLNQWYLVGFTWDGSTHRLYLDGIEVANAPYTGYIGTSAKNSLIGSKYYGSGLVDFFNGDIDDLRIYNRALTQEEITQLYNIGTVAPPVADAGFDQTVTDSDGNGSEQVTLDGSGSSDSDGAITSWDWTDNMGDTIPDGEITTATLSVGTHTITLTVTDNYGLTDADTITVTVEPYPSQPPIPDANLFENFEDDDITNNPAWTVTNPQIGTHDIISDPFRNDNLALQANGTNTAHRAFFTPLNIITSGFYLEVEYAVSLSADEFNLIISLYGQTDFILRTMIASTAPSSGYTGWLIAQNPKGGPEWIQQDPDYPQIPSQPLGEWWKIILWNEPTTEIIYGEIRRVSDNSLVWSRTVSFSSISSNEYITGVFLEIEAIGSQYLDNIYLVSEPAVPPIADADGSYAIYVGDTLTLDASGSTDDENDIVSYLWDLDDNNNFETDAGNQPVFDVNFAYLQSIGLLVGNTYNIHLKVTDSGGLSSIANTTLTILPIPAMRVFVDIKPGSCPNPVNVKSSGVLPVAILGTNTYDVTRIDPTSIRLAGVEPIRSSYEDVATPGADFNDCNCTSEGPDGLLDLTLKFKTQKIVEAIGIVNEGDVLTLSITGILLSPTGFETPIEGTDCIVIRGKHRPFNKFDINQDDKVDYCDFAEFAQNWLQSSIVED